MQPLTPAVNSWSLMTAAFKSWPSVARAQRVSWLSATTARCGPGGGTDVHPTLFQQDGQWERRPARKAGQSARGVEVEPV